MESQAAVATTTFADRLAAAVVDRRSQLVVGIDPQLDLLPVELRGDARLGSEAAAAAVARFSCGLIDSVAPYVVAVKVHLAVFEVRGSAGVRAVEGGCAPARTAQRLTLSPRS